MAEQNKRHVEDKRTDPFAEYFVSGEPGRADKAYAWQTAIGLQDVDKLQPSEYLLNTAKDNIEGDISIEEARLRIESYYEENKHHHPLLNIFPFIKDCFRALCSCQKDT